MKNTTILMLIVAVIVVAGVVLFSGNFAMTQKVVSETPEVVSGDVQKVVIGMKDFNYYPNEIRVKAGQPVEITLDKSVQGCLRSFTVKDFGVSKYMATPDDKVTFTPDKKGTFSFACSMGMAYGKLIVE